MYKIAVVGRGLIGSAAARHLTEMTNGVVAIGPDEPFDRASHSGVFASHYDEGRMTRIVDPAPEWSITAKRSIARYRDIERRSGISFFSPVGYLGIGGPAQSYNTDCARAGLEQGADIDRLTAAQIRTAFPFLVVPDDADGLTETGTAGYISPRAMVSAQSVLAEQGGAAMVREAAGSITSVSGGLEITTLAGNTIKAERAIVAAGAFTQAFGLAPHDLKVKVFGRTVVLAHIDDSLRDHFADMPTIIHCQSGAYVLPPVRYPDGRHYLKIGIGSDADEQLDSPEKLDRWFKSAGSERDRLDFTAFLKSFFPALHDCDAWHTDSCATTFTESGLPIIDFVDDGRLLVAVGGCGKGAKGADDWGLIAASAILGRPWDHPIEKERLTFR